MKFPPCAICLEPMMKNLGIGSCGHVYHKLCLEEWSERSNSCPECKVNALRRITPIYFEALPDDDSDDGPFNCLDDLTTGSDNITIALKVHAQESRIQKLEYDQNTLAKDLKLVEEKYIKCQKMLLEEQEENKFHQSRVVILRKQLNKSEIEKIKQGKALVQKGRDHSKLLDQIDALKAQLRNSEYLSTFRTITFSEDQSSGGNDKKLFDRILASLKEGHLDIETFALQQNTMLQHMRTEYKKHTLEKQQLTKRYSDLAEVNRKLEGELKHLKARDVNSKKQKESSIKLPFHNGFDEIKSKSIFPLKPVKSKHGNQSVNYIVQNDITRSTMKRHAAFTICAKESKKQKVNQPAHPTPIFTISNMVDQPASKAYNLSHTFAGLNPLQVKGSNLNNSKKVKSTQARISKSANNTMFSFCI